MKHRLRFVFALLLGVLLGTQALPAAAQDRQAETESLAPIKVIIDADAGVDDSTAIAYFLSQKTQPFTLLGVTSVAGNTTAENSANNILTMLETANVAAPVLIGASQPLSRTLSSTGKLIHGPDGLWFAGYAHPHDLSGLSRDVSGFYVTMAQQNPGATVIALGPLTNLAQAIRRDPQAMRRFGKIVILGGAKNGGNQTPVSEYNIWQDPEAADVVFRSGIPLEVMPLDSFTTLTFDQQDLDDLREDGTPLAQLLVDPLTQYAQVQTGMGGAASASIPDLAAVMYALHPTLGTPVSSLVEVIPAPRLVRGQTIIATNFSEKLGVLSEEDELSMLVDRVFTEPGFDLFGALGAIMMRRPDNAKVVLDINEKRMKKLFMRALTD